MGGKTNASGTANGVRAKSTECKQMRRVIVRIEEKRW